MSKGEGNLRTVALPFFKGGACMGSCWTCLPFCDNCKPKLYVCPDCGAKASFVFKKCLSCGRPMTPEDEENARREWYEKRKRIDEPK